MTEERIELQDIDDESFTPLQTKLINFWVKLRTSFWYLWIFIGFCAVWVVWNKSSLVPLAWHTDNLDLTYLNLMLSIMAEVSAITILIYTLRIESMNKKQDETDHQTITYLKETLERIEKKLDK